MSAKPRVFKWLNKVAECKFAFWFIYAVREEILCILTVNYWYTKSLSIGSKKTMNYSGHKGFKLMQILPKYLKIEKKLEFEIEFPNDKEESNYYIGRHSQCNFRLDSKDLPCFISRYVIYRI